MTLKTLIDTLSLTEITADVPYDREISGCYIGDLLSWVMGRAESGNVWITIMNNINIVAVATLADVACILLAEGVDVSDEVITKAQAQGVVILSSEKTSYELSKLISSNL